MDIKVFSRFITILGMMILFGGGAMFLYGATTSSRINAANDELAANPQYVKYRLQTGGSHDSGYVREKMRNDEILMDATAYKTKGIYSGIAGAFILFIGIAMFSSARTPEKSE